MPQLSVIVPVYNEAGTVRQILEKIDLIDIDKEVVVVDDGSCDGTEKILRDVKYNNFKIIHHSSNRGKGAAVLTGISHADGEFIIIQDADLEYNPADYLNLMRAIKEDNTDIVLGIRFKQGYHGLFIHRLGNKLLTGLLNFLFNAELNDYATCYKLMRRSALDALNLKARGFDIDVEIICNALKKRKRILEIPISYSPRTYSAGKKIRWLDGLWAIFYILKYRFSD